MNVIEVGKFIAAQRKARGLSQKELADRLYITDKAVSKWERGLAFPDIENLSSLSTLFGCSISEILDGALRDVNNSSNMKNRYSNIVNIDEDYECDVTLDFNDGSSQYISPLLFGDNLEHTRDCVNGGISAQMLKNRKFVGKPGRYGCANEWKQIGDKAYLLFSEGYTHHTESYKMKRRFECNSQTIVNFTDDKVGIMQSGLFVKKDTVYDCAVVLKAVSPLNVTVELSSPNGTVYDRYSFTVSNTEFERVAFKLKSTETDPDASISISFNTKGTLTVGAVSLMPEDNFHGMRWDVIEKMKELSIRILRWPGGNFAGEYHWLDGMLPVDERAPFQSYMWIETQPHTLGYDFHEINTDDFIALCREIGAEAYITINPTWNTPEESAAWVEYCNGDETTEYGKKRIERGFKEPYNVQFWSLGNEFGYGHMEGANTPYEYAKTVSAHGKRMLKVSPNLTLCSSGPYPNDEWVKHSAKALSDIAPIISMHNYPEYPKWTDPDTYKKDYYHLLSRIDAYFIHHTNILREQLADDRIKISLDEWNVWYAWYRMSGVYEGIYAAAFMNAVFEQADKNGIFIACHFESVNEGAMSVYPDKAVLNPSGVAMSLMAKHSDGRVLALVRDAVATEKNGVLTCTLINRSYDGNKRFTLPLRGTVNTAVCYCSDGLEPGTVFEQMPADYEITEGRLNVTLPPHSIVQMTLRR